jgi:purine-nucleoside phosphorylase
MEKRIAQAAEFLESGLDRRPQVGLITGTGLGSAIPGMAKESRFSYEEIPHFPRSTARGHEGALIIGEIQDRAVMAMAGRFHLYEGYSAREIAFPVRVMARLGVNYLLISSAAGGLNPLFRRGDLMVVTDHINLSGHNPLVGINLENFGPRFPDMAQAYDPEVISIARQSAVSGGVRLMEGVYVGVLGPSLETPAETRFLRMIGADAVGMSTVMEAIAGVHCGLRVGAVVVITNVNRPESMEKISIDEVIAAAQEAGPVLGGLWETIIPLLPHG